MVAWSPGTLVSAIVANCPASQQVCITNMLNMANNFGCGPDPVCLCSEADFLYGIRDCSMENCQDPAIATQVINYGAQYCAGKFSISRTKQWNLELTINADAGIVVSGLPGNTAVSTCQLRPAVLLITKADTFLPASEWQCFADHHH